MKAGGKHRRDPVRRRARADVSGGLARTDGRLTRRSLAVFKQWSGICFVRLRCTTRQLDSSAAFFMGKLGRTSVVY